MVEGGLSTPIDKELKYVTYSKNIVDGIPIYVFYIDCNNYFELPLDANVRLPSQRSVPYKRMVETLKTNPKCFILQNMGINVIANSVKVIQSKDTVKLTFPPGTGIVNGGHTQLAILDSKKDDSINGAKVKLEVIEKEFGKEQMSRIAQSRNTASNVLPYSIADKLEYFAQIKNLMRPEFEKHIIWYENRVVPNKGMTPVDLIALLHMFNIYENSSDYCKSKSQPNSSALGKSSVFTNWENHQDSYLHTYPLINDIIILQEHIQSTFNFKCPTGFTRIKVIQDSKNTVPKKSMFLGKELTYDMPKQLLMPIMAGLRADVYYDEKKGIVGWFEDPEKLFDRCKPQLLDIIANALKTTYHNEVVQASRDKNLWQMLYMTVYQEVNKNSVWRKFNIPK